MIKTLLKSVREYKTASILCPIVMVGEAVMEILIPFFMAQILGQFNVHLEYVKNPSGDDWNITYIVTRAVIMIVCAAFALICGVWGGKLARENCGNEQQHRRSILDAA